MGIPTSRYEVLLRRPEGCVFALPGISVGYYVDSFGVEMAAGLRRMATEMVRRNPRGHVSLSICYAPSMSVRGYSDERVRRDLMALLELMRANHIEPVIVIEGEGFGAATLRAAALGMSLLVRGKFQPRYAATVLDAADWIHRDSAVRASVAPRGDILDAVADLKLLVAAPAA